MPSLLADLGLLALVVLLLAAAFLVGFGIAELVVRRKRR